MLIPAEGAGTGNRRKLTKMNLLIRTLAWLNAEPEERSIRLQRDGVYPFLSYADLSQPLPPLLTFRSVSWLLLLAVGLPVVFLV